MFGDCADQVSEEETLRNRAIRSAPIRWQGPARRGLWHPPSRSIE
ncbi:hypothetical protein JOF47_004162 [Paeniglutamicibacter kerguelensis]|uniref:Uncharacterized protein n=1 Tax=Paeniglutamicibacter kerguelensis TaxID=254788 RepID=A0ABS4XJE4_9MICC|nr:hypothetical protein [Paeniglutamicibacter kerguelensis]